MRVSIPAERTSAMFRHEPSVTHALHLLGSPFVLSLDVHRLPRHPLQLQEQRIFLPEELQQQVLEQGGAVSLGFRAPPQEAVLRPNHS